jgi:hypothetical protein
MVGEIFAGPLFIRWIAYQAHDAGKDKKVSNRDFNEKKGEDRWKCILWLGIFGDIKVSGREWRWGKHLSTKVKQTGIVPQRILIAIFRDPDFILGQNWVTEWFSEGHSYDSFFS